MMRSLVITHRMHHKFSTIGLLVYIYMKSGYPCDEYQWQLNHLLLGGQGGLGRWVIKTNATLITSD